MEIVRHTDLGEFDRLARPLYAADPLRHTIPLTVLHGLVRTGGEPDLALTVQERGTVVGAVLSTGGWPPAVSGLPPAHAPAVAAALAGEVVSGASGPVPEAEAFGAAWAALTGGEVRPRMRTRLHVLGTLTPPPAVPGAARRAGEADLAVLAALHEAFQLEEFPDLERRTPFREQVEQRLAMGDAEWLWEDRGEPVSLASARPVVAGSSRVGPVYTPPEHRRRGYAAAVTTAASRWALDEGAERVLLFTDAANALTNRLYARLGYRFHHDAVELRFTTRT